MARCRPARVDCGRSGTTSLTQALMDLGSARTCAGNTHLRLEDERRAKIHA